MQMPGGVGQVFDSGLIGEGVLHLIAWAKARLLTDDATLVGVSSVSCVLCIKSSSHMDKHVHHMHMKVNSIKL